jgi:hypothetical protein
MWLKLAMQKKLAKSESRRIVRTIDRFNSGSQRLLQVAWTSIKHSPAIFVTSTTKIHQHSMVTTKNLGTDFA